MFDILMTVLPLFLQAGWSPARRQTLDPGVPSDHPGAAVLATFGGLHVGECGSGIECARSDIQFEWVGSDDFEEIRLWEQSLGTVLVSVAWVHHYHAILLVDRPSRSFLFATTDWSLGYLGASFGEAVEGQLLGLRYRPVFRPAQTTQMFYGREIGLHHPTAFRCEDGRSSPT